MAAPAVQDALAAHLEALGFAAMARDVLTERDPGRLRLYARIVAKNTPPQMRAALVERLRAIGAL